MFQEVLFLMDTYLLEIVTIIFFIALLLLQDRKYRQKKLRYIYSAEIQTMSQSTFFYFLSYTHTIDVPKHHMYWSTSILMLLRITLYLQMHACNLKSCSNVTACLRESVYLCVALYNVPKLVSKRNRNVANLFEQAFYTEMPRR